jgi:hypothetical protein
MKVATGRVVGGKVVLEGEPLPEGAVVTVVARDHEDSFEVAPEEEQALLEAIQRSRTTASTRSSQTTRRSPDS